MEKKRVLLPEVSLSRITIPKSNPHFIVRDALLSKLDQNAPHAFILVAPSGFGKTDLAAQWANQKPELTAWYTAEAGDSARDILFHVIEGFRKIDPDFCSWAQDLPETEFEPELVARKFSNELSELGPEVRIVFDNLGDLTGEGAAALNLAWQANAPMNVKTLTTRRTIPNSNFTRAANLGVLTYLTAKDLRFTDFEINALIKSRGLESRIPELRIALSSTDGWPAGVQMLIKLCLEQGITNESLRELPQTDEKIIATTLNSLSARDSDLLFSIGLLDDVSENELAMLTSDSDAAVRLRNMALDGTFVTSKNYGGEIFTINTLILEHIRKVSLQNTEELKVRALKAIEVIKDSDPYRTFELYLIAGEVKKAENYVLENIRRLIVSGKNKEIENFIEIISTSFNFDEERKLILAAYVQASNGRVDEAERELLRYSNQFGLSTPGEELRSGSKADVETTQNVIDFLRGHLTSTIQGGLAIPSADSSMGNLDQIRQLVVLHLVASAAFLLEDSANLKIALDVASSVELENADPASHIYIPSIKALHALGNGELQISEINARLALQSALKQKPSGIFIPFAAAYCLAEVHREKGELNEALRLCDEYIQFASKFSMTPWLVALIAKKALVLSHLGRDSLALNLIAEAREFVPSQKYSQEISRIIDEHELLIRVTLADTERIKELLFRMPQTDTTLAFATAFQAMQSPSRAGAILDSYRDVTIRNLMNKALIGAEIYKSQPSRAKELLREAINLGITHGYFQIFLLQTPTVRDLILDLAGEEPTIYLEHLAKKLRAKSQSAFTMGSSTNHSLTKRELDILRRLSTGLPITQIAANLHISNNTIKSHLKNVYRKLKVDSRQSAVSKAQELALL